MNRDVTVDAVAVSVVVLAHGAEPHLRECVAAILASVDADGIALDLELVLVDNGAGAQVAASLPDDRIRVEHPATNLGFAGGCNLAAASSRGRTLAFVNSDAIVAPVALHALSAALADRSVGMVSGGVRLADRPGLMNTAGNPVHFLGAVWAGGYGEPCEGHDRPVDVPSVSGAFFALRRSVWDELGGFDDEFFAYHEDTDLSLRAWQRGYRVRFEPAAVAWHHYEFSRNPSKQYLLERNRWITVLTDYPSRVLIGVLPALVVFELPMCLEALIQGWLPDKLRGYRWLATHNRYLRRRRQEVQSRNRMSPRAFSALLAARIEPAAIERPPGLGILNVLLECYWSAVRTVARLN